MTTDELETSIRSALQAEDVTAADLRQPRLRPVRTRRGPSGRVAARGWVAAAATVAVVLAVAVASTVIGVLASRGDHGRAGPSGHAMDAVIGYRWRVTAISDRHGIARVPTSYGAEVSFTRNGEVLGDDTVNELNGRYRQVAGGYAASMVGSTLIGFFGPPQSVRSRTIAVVDTLFNGVGTTSHNTQPVAVSLRGGILTLRCDGVSVTATRGGRQPGPAPASPTSTSGSFAGASFRYLGPLKRRTVLAAGDLLLTPPGALRPKLTPAQAFERLCSQTSCAHRSARADIVLALMTTPKTGHERSDGSIIPSVQNRLSYVIRWPEAACYGSSGPAGPSGEASFSPARVICRETDPVDADTGKPGVQYLGS